MRNDEFGMKSTKKKFEIKFAGLLDGGKTTVGTPTLKHFVEHICPMGKNYYCDGSSQSVKYPRKATCEYYQDGYCMHRGNPKNTNSRIDRLPGKNNKKR